MPNIILAAHGGITTHFREDIGRGFLHNGIDQGHGDGTPYDLEIRAPADGVVEFAGEMGTYGWCLFIRHDDGWLTVLAHHKKGSHLVSKGQRVKQRQLLAVMGNTGTVFVHSHEELRDAHGNQLDPLLHLGATASLNETDLPGKKKKLMSQLIRNYDGSIGLVTEDGELVPLASMNEVESLKATGLVGEYAQMADGNVWNTLTSITARKIAQRAATDPAAIAAHVAPLVVSAVLASLKGVASLTQAQVEAAAEQAIRAVFADAGA